MSPPPPPPPPTPAARLLREYGWDLMLGSIAAFYAVLVPYTKVEESFNVQAMHDILYHNYHIEKYDHLEFPGVVPRTFIGALVISIISSPAVFIMRLFHVPKVYGLLAVRLVLGCVTLMTLRLFRVEVKRKYGRHVEAFFVILTAIQFHLLFYSTRPLPNIFALALVNLAYSFWFKGNYLCTLQALIVAAVVFRCDMILLLGTIGIALLLSRSFSLLEAVKCCISTAFLCIGFTVLVDSIVWRRILWPEFEVFWFNSVLNRSSEWGTHSIHWYFTSALPRSMLVAYPLCLVGALLDRRIVPYVLPVFLFVVLYSKLPHKELRFIIGSIPMLNVSASLAASRLYNNRKKAGWNLLYVLMLGAFLASLGYSAVTFMASYNNYPGGHALKALHEADSSVKEKMVHIDAFTAMSGVSRFCENEYPWRLSGGMRKPTVTSLRNRITDRRIVASEQTENIECSSFDITTINLSVLVLIAPLMSNILCRGAKETDNFRPTDRPKACKANTDWRNGYPTLSVSDFESKKKMRNMIQDERYPFVSAPIAPLAIRQILPLRNNVEINT